MAQVSVAQGPPSGGPPPGAPPGGAPPAGAMRPASKDPTAAPAGTYALDLQHHAVIARASHGGVSFNVLRFAAKQGALVWDPSNPGRSKLKGPSMPSRSPTPSFTASKLTPKRCWIALSFRK